MPEQRSSKTYSAEALYGELLGELLGEANAGGLVQGADASHLEGDWRIWLPTLFPRYLSDPEAIQVIPFGEHHEQYWNWVWSLRRGISPRPFIAIWPRGGGKSTSSELASVVVGALRSRRYVLYVCETLDRAEDHVQNVASMLESRAIERYYPHVASPMVGKFGSPKGWRRNRLRTPALTVDAIGLDIAARGIKLDEVRPDLIIFDDIDSETDSQATTERKIAIITKKFLPAGAADLAVLGVQNLIHSDSIFSRLAGVSSEKADFLHERIVSGPFPAVHDLTYKEEDGRYVVTGGKPIWQGMDLSRCQEFINRYGLSAFLSESQQEVDVAAGGMFDHLTFRHCTYDELPDLVRTTVWVDPAVTSKDSSDAHGIQADGIAEDGTIFRLWSWEQRATPEKALVLAITKGVEIGALEVGVETDQGGDTWEIVYRDLCQKLLSTGIEIEGRLYKFPPDTRLPVFRGEKAGAGHDSKAHRASHMLTDYERGRFVHVVGTHELLERALKRFPKVKPFDLVDASYWSWYELTQKQRAFRASDIRKMASEEMSDIEETEWLWK